MGYANGQDIRFINGKLRKVKLDNKGKIIDHNKIIVDKEFKNMAKRPVTDRLIDVDGKLVIVPDKLDQNKDKDSTKNTADEHKEKDSATEQPTKIDKINDESTAKDEIKEFKEVKKESTTATKAKKGGKFMNGEETTEQTIARMEKEKKHVEELKDALSFAKEGREGIKVACTGIECLKNDMNKRIDDLTKSVEKVLEPSFTCQNCGENHVRALSSFCYNCGSEIKEWNDDFGNKIKTWKPYWARLEANKNASKK